MKIRLIEPRPPSVHLMSPWRYPRLGLPMIGAALAAGGHDVRITCEQLTPIDWDDLTSAELVGLSTTTSTAPAAYAMADLLRARGVPVVIGGSHVTFMADEALRHADFVARGEGGDELMPELIEALRGERELESIAGLSFVRRGHHVHNELRPPRPDLDQLPVPDLSLIAGHERMRSIPILTSLGCPFGCSFCSVTAMFGRKYRFRSAESVIAEIEGKRPSHIFFYDDNFAADRKRLKRLLRGMIAHGLVIPWQAQVRTDAAGDAELLELMRASGCETLALGLESVDQATLDALHKAQSVADIESAVDAIHHHGIRVHGMFVLGADSDDRDTMRHTIDFAVRRRIDTVMLNVLTPAPGTGWFEEVDAAGRIFDKRWQLYDGQHVVITPTHMEPSELQAAVLEGYARFYSPAQWLKCLLERRWLSLRDHTWCLWYARRWAHSRANRDYLHALKLQ
ncbi:MAG TPA: radical SAM protein [Thermoleophilia bacterium]|nr:radical SAM protein [Thermoleophilia bacterium]